MRHKQSLILIVSCCLVFWSVGGCVTGAPTIRNLTITSSKMQDLLEEQLSEVKPMVIKYLGLPENTILEYRASSANPLSLEVARRSGTHESFVLDFRPSRLPAREYPWYGEVEFFVQRFGERQCKAECFYDDAQGHWLLDQILVAEPIIYEGKPANFLRPIEPSPGWKPTDPP